MLLLTTYLVGIPSTHPFLANRYYGKQQQQQQLMKKKKGSFRCYNSVKSETNINRKEIIVMANKAIFNCDYIVKNCIR